MCLASVYEEDRTTLLMENCKSLTVNGDTIIVRDLFGATKTYQGSIEKIDFEENMVVLRGKEA